MLFFTPKKCSFSPFSPTEKTIYKADYFGRNFLRVSLKVGVWEFEKIATHIKY